MDKKIKYTGPDEIVCPYCGYEYSDSWEFDGDDSSIDCEQCGKEFDYSRIVDICYTTRKKEIK
jgi:uncharacterized Zn-finger protein